MNQHEAAGAAGPDDPPPLQSPTSDADPDAALAARLLSSARRHRVTAAERQRVWEAVAEAPRPLLGRLGPRLLPALVVLGLLGGATVASATIGRGAVARLIERLGGAPPAAPPALRLAPTSPIVRSAPPAPTASLAVPAAPPVAPAAVAASATPADTSTPPRVGARPALGSRPLATSEPRRPSATPAATAPVATASLAAGAPSMHARLAPAPSLAATAPSAAAPALLAPAPAAAVATPAAAGRPARTPLDDDRGDEPPVAAAMGPDPAAAVQGRGRNVSSLDELPVYDAVLADNRHDAARAATLLDGYLAAHPRGSMAEEALALRIKVALERHEDHPEGPGERYLRAYPAGRFIGLARFATSRRVH